MIGDKSDSTQDPLGGENVLSPVLLSYHSGMTRRTLWMTFCVVQLLGAIGATVGVMWNFYFAIAGMFLLLPGYLVAYAFLRKVSSVSVLVLLAGLAVAIPLNAAFWYGYSRKRSPER